MHNITNTIPWTETFLVGALAAQLNLNTFLFTIGFGIFALYLLPTSLFGRSLVDKDGNSTPPGPKGQKSLSHSSFSVLNV
jgi:hypothetical protein